MSGQLPMPRSSDASGMARDNSNHNGSKRDNNDDVACCMCDTKSASSSFKFLELSKVLSGNYGDKR